MKLTPDTLATIFGTAAAVAQVLGQSGIINQPTSTAISSVAIALLGWISNKPKNIAG